METEEGEIITYSKNEIEQGIMEANRKKLLQASDTPLRSDPYQELLGEQANYDKWEQILEKQLQVPDNAHEELKMWFHYMTNYANVEFEFSWTTEEYMESWAKMDENKVTTPGIQVAHIKCLHPQSSSATIMSQLALIPLISGYSPKIWKIGIDLMIPKKTADLRPDKLRLILLMDARFNHNNKLIGKKMMEIGEKYGWLAQEQFGSRKAKSACEHALNKRICFDIIWQQRLEAVYIANDAKSCYDRILLMVAYLTMRNYGIPTLVAQSSIESIFRMKQFIRTKYGDSKDYYGGDKWDVLPHGCGQGNGYGPALWACISSPLFELMKTRNHGARFRSCLTSQELHLAGIAFVDDTDLFEANSTATIPDITAKGQEALQHWNSFLRVTGGALEPTKTFWCKMGGTTNGMHELSIQNGDSVAAIPRRSPEEAFFTLGIWQSPNGHETQQINYLQAQVSKWSKTTGTNFISKYSARTAILSTIGRTLAYPLAATAFSSSECQQLQKTINSEVLGRMGIVRTASRILANTPTSLGGFGILDVRVEQTVQHVNTLLIHMHQKTLTSQLIQLSLDQYILEAGKAGSPFEYPYCSYVTERTWIANTIAAMQSYNLRIQGHINSLDAWTRDDKFIMDVVHFTSASDARRFNNVRLFLQVATLSDLMSASGLTFDPQLLKGEKSQCHPSPSKWRYHWPAVDEPHPSDKLIWATYLRSTFLVGTDGRSTTYCQRLQWSPQAIRFSQWLFSVSSDQVYEKRENMWVRWTPQLGTRSRGGRRRCFRLATETDNIPVDVVPCSVSQHSHSILLTTLGQVHESLAITTGPNGTNDSDKWVLGNMHFPDNGIGKLLYHIINGSGIVHTDGSYIKDGKVTYSAVFGYGARNSVFDPRLLTDYIHGYNAVPGALQDGNSYRGELAGLLSAISFVNQICTTHGVTSGRCVIYCDNKGALAAAFGHKRPMPKWSSYDLVTMISFQLQNSPVQWTPRHVKSHQDDVTAFHKLSLAAQGNVLADFLTTKGHGVESPRPTSLLPGEPWRVKMQGQTAGGNILFFMRDSIYHPRIQQHWIHVFKLSQDVAARCMWNLFYQRWREQTRDSRIWWSKFASRIHPIGRNLVRRRHSDFGKCPCCGANEDPEHLIRCSSDKIKRKI